MAVVAAPRAYTTTRVRGLAPWSPRRPTLRLLDQVRAVLDEYAAHLPLTCRQVFYRLVGAHGYDKTEAAYARLLEAMNRARRSGLVPFDAIRDDGVVASEPTGFHGVPDFLDTIRASAERYRRDRMAYQPVAVEVWVEAGGMVPQAARVAHEVGATVYSSGGFDSLSTKREAAGRILARPKPTVILHVGDYDPSGVSIFDSARDDVTQLVADLAGVEEAGGLVEFRRVAVTPDQVERYGLATSPAKATDRRGDWTGGTVQVEALTPADLAHELREALFDAIDQEALAGSIAAEEVERAELLARFGAVGSLSHLTE